MKSFHLGGRIVETRLLIKRTGHPGWDGYSYKWNQDRTEAFLLGVAETAEYPVSSPEGGGTRGHYFPARGQCGDCHTPASGYVLGLRTGQMNRGGLIERWEREGLFAGELPPAESWASWPEPADESAPLEPRARAYLAANCANCHRPGHGIRARFDLRFETPMAETGLLERARLADLGVDEGWIVEPGEPRRSLLYLRMLDTGRWRMPPLATALVDTLGARLVGRWIERLGDPTGRHGGAGRADAAPRVHTAAAVSQPGQRGSGDPLRSRGGARGAAGALQPRGPASRGAAGGDGAAGPASGAMGRRGPRQRPLPRAAHRRRPDAVTQGGAAALKGWPPDSGPAPWREPAGWLERRAGRALSPAVLLR